MISTTASILTVTIAAIVAFIAWLQWRTAREKVVLDLFDKRFAMYDEMRAVVTRYTQHGIDDAGYNQFLRASSRAQFLFGPEVKVFLEATKVDLMWEMATSTIDPRTPVPPEKRETVSAEWVERKNRLSAFPRTFDQMVSPYLKHHQKAGDVAARWRCPVGRKASPP